MRYTLIIYKPEAPEMSMGHCVDTFPAEFNIVCSEDRQYIVEQLASYSCCDARKGQDNVHEIHLLIDGYPAGSINADDCVVNNSIEMPGYVSENYQTWFNEILEAAKERVPGLIEEAKQAKIEAERKRKEADEKAAEKRAETAKQREHSEYLRLKKKFEGE